MEIEKNHIHVKMIDIKNGGRNYTSSWCCLFSPHLSVIPYYFLPMNNFCTVSKQTPIFYFSMISQKFCHTVAVEYAALHPSGTYRVPK